MQLNVKCADCGKELTATIGTFALNVDPCETCCHRAYDDGYKDGHSDGWADAEKESGVLAEARGMGVGMGIDD